MLGYMLARDLLRAVFSPRTLPLAWPLQFGALIVLGLGLLVVLYLSLLVMAARWVSRAVCG
jgi:hypothetical protein